MVLKKQGVDLNVLKISSDEGEGPKMTNALHYPSNAGGHYMMDFFHICWLILIFTHHQVFCEEIFMLISILNTV